VNRRATGITHEVAAARHLESHGLVVIERNVGFRVGEIDLVLADGDTVVFAEVRYRRGEGWGGAAASVDAGKRRRLVAAAQAWLARHPEAARRPCRFDVVAVGGVTPYRIDWLRDAFQPED
jgi:putative endonuclease